VVGRTGRAVLAGADAQEQTQSCTPRLLSAHTVLHSCNSRQMWQDDVHWWPVRQLRGICFVALTLRARSTSWRASGSGAPSSFRNTTELVSFDLRRESDA